jgi:hypothetical protein
MLKKISVALLATALLTSPVFAAKPKTAPAPAQTEQKCGKAEELAKAIVADKGKIEYDLSGDELAKINAFVKSKNGVVPPEGTDRVIIISKPDATVWIGIIFVHGCAAMVTPIKPDNFKKLLESVKGESV